MNKLFLKNDDSTNGIEIRNIASALGSIFVGNNQTNIQGQQTGSGLNLSSIISSVMGNSSLQNSVNLWAKHKLSTMANAIVIFQYLFCIIF